MQLFFFVGLLLASCVSATERRFLVINDIHLNIESTDYLIPPPGEECTIALLDQIVKQARDQVNKEGIELTAIFIPGDFNRHGLSAKDITIPNPNWPIMIETMTMVINTVQKYFPDTPILPGIGNNDCYYHDQASSADNSTMYYSELRDIFFKNQSSIYNNDTITESWM
jgi:hypothetical protein